MECSEVHVESGAVFNLSAIIDLESPTGVKGQASCHGGTGGNTTDPTCSYGSMYHPTQAGLKAKG